ASAKASAKASAPPLHPPIPQHPTRPERAALQTRRAGYPAPGRHTATPAVNDDAAPTIERAAHRNDEQPKARAETRRDRQTAPPSTLEAPPCAHPVRVPATPQPARGIAPETRQAPAAVSSWHSHPEEVAARRRERTSPP